MGMSFPSSGVFTPSRVSVKISLALGQYHSSFGVYNVMCTYEKLSAF